MPREYLYHRRVGKKRGQHSFKLLLREPLGSDFFEATAPFRELRFLLNSYIRIARERSIKPETVFQEFFEAHPDLVLRDGYTHLWAKPRLERPEGGPSFLALLQV